MRIYRMLFLAAAIMIAQMALAKLPFAIGEFGRTEGTLDFCAKVHPEAAPQYQERKKAMAGDVPEKELAEARGAKEYKDAYEEISAKLGEVQKDQAVAACKAYLEGK
jgi:hypothetical protein